MTINVTWTCDCGEVGTGWPPRQCPECWESLAPTTQEDIRAIRGLYEGIYERAERIAAAHGYGCDSIEFGQDTFEVTWETRACARGCCGYDTHYKTIPMHYLWTDDWEAQIKAAQKAEAKAEAEAEKQRKLEVARKRLAKAEEKKASSFMDAETDLQKAREELAALEAA